MNLVDLWSISVHSRYEIAHLLFISFKLGMLMFLISLYIKTNKLELEGFYSIIQGAMSVIYIGSGSFLAVALLFDIISLIK